MAMQHAFSQLNVLAAACPIPNGPLNFPPNAADRRLQTMHVKYNQFPPGIARSSKIKTWEGIRSRVREITTLTKDLIAEGNRRLNGILGSEQCNTLVETKKQMNIPKFTSWARHKA
jgi:hypothetical protein